MGTNSFLPTGLPTNEPPLGRWRPSAEQSFEIASEAGRDLTVPEILALADDIVAAANAATVPAGEEHGDIGAAEIGDPDPDALRAQRGSTSKPGR